MSSYCFFSFPHQKKISEDQHPHELTFVRFVKILSLCCLNGRISSENKIYQRYSSTSSSIVDFWFFFLNLKYKILLQKNYHLHILSFYEALKYIQSKNIYCVTKYQIY